ncbi:hypothetical protein CYLTODRAFT_410010 [Cylindrobasidium torrendii FP15055 ss-10]|uniref:Uncharacterized protein n=1 Tax=Cylindrobasidium torrendii FP15055 ss-10 TaxID=1314674 RepID=A0A0D7BFH4_9AGAR|nr:hypothetical protein CYLTODRAFT_410010 [Cylindrobasidium torrendii FP15055 ss-10]
MSGKLWRPAAPRPGKTATCLGAGSGSGIRRERVVDHPSTGSCSGSTTIVIMSSLGGSIGLVEVMPTEILTIILGFLYDSMNLWDFIESSVFGPNISNKTLRDVDWETMSPFPWDMVLRHMKQVVTTLKNDARVRDFVSCHFTLFIPGIPDSDYFAYREGFFIGDLLKDTVEMLALMTQLTSFNLIAEDDKVQQIISQAFLQIDEPHFADLLQSFPRLKYLSIGESEFVGEFYENIFVAIVNHCPELEILVGLGSEALNKSEIFVTSFKKDDRFHGSLRYLSLEYEYPVSWDDHDADDIELEFEHLGIFPLLLELHIPVSMWRRDIQSTQNKWSDTAAIEKLKDNATMFLRSQLERKKAMNRTEGKDESELVASLVIENNAEPMAFIEETIRL